jgi:hypothetical protein
MINDFLKFTAVLWKPNEEPTSVQSDPWVSINADLQFPFLDMELSWDDERDLSFGVHLKLNQQLKYLNKGSAHTSGCFLAITNGVCKWLTKLTMIIETTKLETP